MQMINVLKRLEELDSKNSNVVQAQPLAEGLAECGMMGGMSQPHSPATINMTADSGAELTGMLRDIMQLAGLKQVGPDDLGHEHDPSVISAEPSISVAKVDDEPSVMRSMIDKMNPDEEIPSDKREEETMEYVDNTPNKATEVPSFDAETYAHQENQPGQGDRFDGINPKAYPTTEERLMAEYKKFLGEDQSATEGMSDHEDEYSIRSAVLDVLQTIYDGASAGEEMIDTVADELGDYYDEVEQSGDSELMKAYRFVREKGADAEGNPEMMAKIVQKAMSVLGNNQDTAEGFMDTLKGAVGLGPKKGPARTVLVKIRPSPEARNVNANTIRDAGLQVIHDVSEYAPASSGEKWFTIKTDIADDSDVRSKFNSEFGSLRITTEPFTPDSLPKKVPTDQRIPHDPPPSIPAPEPKKYKGPRLGWQMPDEKTGVRAGDLKSVYRRDGTFHYESADTMESMLKLAGLKK